MLHFVYYSICYIAFIIDPFDMKFWKWICNMVTLFIWEILKNYTWSTLNRCHYSSLLQQVLKLVLHFQKNPTFHSTNDEHFFYLYIFVQTNGVHPSILIFDQVFYNAPAFKTNNNASTFRWEFSTTIFIIMTLGSLIADLVPKISSRPLSLESEKKSFVFRWLNL